MKKRHTQLSPTLLESDIPLTKITCSYITIKPSYFFFFFEIKKQRHTFEIYTIVDNLIAYYIRKAQISGIESLPTSKLADFRL